MRLKHESLWDEIICANCELVFGHITPVYKRIMSAALGSTRDLRDNVTFHITDKWPNDPQVEREDVKLNNQT